MLELFKLVFQEMIDGEAPVVIHVSIGEVGFTFTGKVEVK